MPRHAALRYDVLTHYPGEQPDVKPEWPMTRPLESFLDFYVSPTTHLVRPAHAPSPMLPYHPLGAPCTHTHTHTYARAPPLPRRSRTRPNQPVRALTSARALSVIRAAGVRKHVGGAVGRRCVYDVQALSLITMRVLRDRDSGPCECVSSVRGWTLPRQAVSLALAASASGAPRASRHPASALYGIRELSPHKAQDGYTGGRCGSGQCRNLPAWSSDTAECLSLDPC